MAVPAEGQIHRKTYDDQVAAGDKAQDIVPALADHFAVIDSIQFDGISIAHSDGWVYIYSDDTVPKVAYRSSAGHVAAGPAFISGVIRLGVKTDEGGKKWTLKHATGPMTYHVVYHYEAE